MFITIKPIIKQEVLNKDGLIKKVFNKYIKSLNNKNNKTKNIIIVF
jgi:hypothetical protein